MMSRTGTMSREDAPRGRRADSRGPGVSLVAGDSGHRGLGVSSATLRWSEAGGPRAPRLSLRQGVADLLALA